MTWPTFLSLVSVGGALPVEFRLTDPGESGAELVRVAMVVSCVLSDKEIEISRVVSLPAWTTESAAAEWVRDQVRWMYRHEADEQIWIGESRPFLPDEDHA